MIDDKRIENDFRNNHTMMIETSIEIDSWDNQNDDSREYFTTMSLSVIETNDTELT
jgi:hypothetical protein